MSSEVDICRKTYLTRTENEFSTIIVNQVSLLIVLTLKFLAFDYNIRLLRLMKSDKDDEIRKDWSTILMEATDSSRRS